MTRRAYLAAAGVALAAMAVAAAAPLPVKLLWNATASTPVGFYTIDRADRLAVDDLVVVAPPATLERFLVARGYIGPGVPLVKRVAGLPGQVVCRTGAVITVDWRARALALERDSRGRPLPVWRGCDRLGAGEIFLLNGQIRASLDGRYFGPLPMRAVIGRAHPLYTDEAGDGRFVWRAPAR